MTAYYTTQKKPHVDHHSYYEVLRADRVSLSLFLSLFVCLSLSNLTRPPHFQPTTTTTAAAVAATVDGDDHEARRGKGNTENTVPCTDRSVPLLVYLSSTAVIW